jgi:hypothetical protein
MSDNTPRLILPYIVQSQAQKEVTHAVGLNRLDALTQTAVETIALIAPPAGTEGNMYIVGSGATGAWAAKDKQIAQFIGGSWVFYIPFEGMRVWDKQTAQPLVYKGSTWQNEFSAANRIGFFGATPVVKSTVSFGNTDNEIGGLPVSASYSQAEMQVLRDKCEELADDVRTLRSALSSYGLI